MMCILGSYGNSFCILAVVFETIIRDSDLLEQFVYFKKNLGQLIWIKIITWAEFQKGNNQEMKDFRIGNGVQNS